MLPRTWRTHPHTLLRFDAPMRTCEQAVRFPKHTDFTHICLPWTLCSWDLACVASPPLSEFSCNSALLAPGETAAPVLAQVRLLCKLTRKRPRVLNGKHAGDDTAPAHTECVIFQCGCLKFHVKSARIFRRSTCLELFAKVWLKILKSTIDVSAEEENKNDEAQHRFSFRSWTLVSTFAEASVLFIVTIKTMLKEEKKRWCFWPSTSNRRQQKKKNVTNVRLKAEKKKTDSFRKVKSSDVFTACKLKPGPGCQRARGWCHRVVLGDKNRNYKCWKSQTGACVESPVTPPLCSTLWGTWLTGSQVWAQTLLSSVGAPRATPPHTPISWQGKTSECAPPPSTLTLYSASTSPVARLQTLDWSL